MPEFIDTHCHLAHEKLIEQADKAVSEAAVVGVTKIICAAADIDESRRAEEIARRHESVYFTAGLHPHEAQNAPADYIAELTALAAASKNVAIGEMGLDYHYDFSPRAVQQEIFAAQLELARKLSKCAVVHCRNAFEDALAIIEHSCVSGEKILFHCFTDSLQAARKVLDIGAMMSFAGVLTFKKSAALREAAAIVPDNRLLIETDAPYLSPEPVRGQKINSPANVVHTAACLAATRQTTIEQIAEITTANALKFFKLQQEITT